MTLFGTSDSFIVNAFYLHSGNSVDSSYSLVFCAYLYTKNLKSTTVKCVFCDTF